jgi:Spy/CpxP family protein refolding chaperone
MSKLKFALITALPLVLASIAMAAEPAPQTVPVPHKDRAAMHQQMCAERFADRAGRLAYLEAKLALTEQQRPLFNQWRQSVLDGAGKERAACQALTVSENAPPTIVQREDHLEKMLAAKLQDMQSSRPALQALYDALTPTQRAVLDHPHHRHGNMHRPMMHGGRP